MRLTEQMAIHVSFCAILYHSVSFCIQTDMLHTLRLKESCTVKGTHLQLGRNQNSYLLILNLTVANNYMIHYTTFKACCRKLISDFVDTKMYERDKNTFSSKFLPFAHTAHRQH